MYSWYMPSLCLVAPVVVASTNYRFTIFANPRAAYMFRSDEHSWTTDRWGHMRLKKGGHVLLCMQVEDRPSSLRFDARSFSYAERAYDEEHPRIFHDCSGARPVGAAPMVRPLTEAAYEALLGASARGPRSWSLWEEGSVAFERGERSRRIEQVMLRTPLTARGIAAAFNVSLNG